MNAGWEGWQGGAEEVSLDSAEMERESEGLEGNQDAARALLRIKQKLDGYEEGEVRSLQGQVSQ